MGAAERAVGVQPNGWELRVMAGAKLASRNLLLANASSLAGTIPSAPLPQYPGAFECLFAPVQPVGPGVSQRRRVLYGVGSGGKKRRAIAG